MADVLVQVSTENDDHFMTVDEDELKKIASRLKGRPQGSATKAELDEMARDFWKLASSATVSRSSECDYGLVLDRDNDEESWGELLEGWAEEDEAG